MFFVYKPSNCLPFIDSPSPSSFIDGVDSGGPQAGGIKACSTPVSAQNRHSKEAERVRPSSTTGLHTPAMLSPGSSSSFPRPIYPVPLLSHVPLVRPPPPQLHPSVVQRMIAQGIQPQQLGPALLQTGGDWCLTAEWLLLCRFICFMETFLYLGLPKSSQ